MEFKCDTWFICRRDYVFWVDFNGDNIVRGTGIVTLSPSSVINLVTTDISSAGKRMYKLHRKHIKILILQMAWLGTG